MHMFYDEAIQRDQNETCLIQVVPLLVKRKYTHREESDMFEATDSSRTYIALPTIGHTTNLASALLPGFNTIPGLMC